MAIRVRFDDEDLDLPEGATVGDLLRTLDLSAPILSVARNGRIVPRGEYDTCVLADGDQLIGVIQVGGG